MPRAVEPSSRRFAFRPLAIAAAAAMLLIAGIPVQAQSFTQNGANSTTPNNLLPFVGNPSSLDFSADVVFIGNGTPGSFAAMGGALLKAGSFLIGNGGTGAGDVVFSGTGTKVDLGGTGLRLSVGHWGTGSLTISAGALVDAAVDATACFSASCAVQIGNAAGSNGTLLVTGTGSELMTLRSLSIGSTFVFSQSVDGFDLGTPGGTTTASVKVLDGGVLRSGIGMIGNAPRFGGALGTEKSFSEVLIDGANSRWLISHNTVDNQAAGLTIAGHVNATADVKVSGGGKIVVNGSSGPGPNDFINIASNGGKGALTVTGVGSSVDVVGKNTVINVGRSGTGAQGSFSVLAGANASTLYVNVGRDGASGTMLIDGAGSVLTQAGVGGPQSFPPSTNGPAFTHVGRNGGTGSVTVSNGGQWLISDGGGDGRTAVASPGIALGRDANASGSLLITGAGSKVEIVSTSLNPAAGVGDNYNPFFAVGFDNAATTSGTLTVSGGGKLILTGNALSTVADGRATQLAIGGRSGTAGTGTATVTGEGSEIIVQGNGGLINVGREAGGNGTLSVLAGGKVSSTSLAVGIATTGTVNIDNAWIALSGTRTDTSPLVGAGTTFGRGAGGNGTLNMVNGARLTIDPILNTAGISLGGDQFGAGGTGTMTMSGGSSITIGGPLAGNSVNIGNSGSALAAMNASTITNTTGDVFVGRVAGGSGRLELNAGSVVNAAFVGIGVNAAGTGNALGTAGGTGTLVLNNSTINTSRFELGANGLLTGNNGVINAGVNGPVVIGGTISPGTSPGRLRINCDLTMLSGSKLILEIDDNGVSVDIDQLIIGEESNFDLFQMQIIFSFLGSTNPEQVDLNLNRFLRAGATGSNETTGLQRLFKVGDDWDDVVNSRNFAFQSSVYDVTGFEFNAATGGITGVEASAIPEPATYAMVLLALGLMSVTARRRAALLR